MSLHCKLENDRPEGELDSDSTFQIHLPETTKTPPLETVTAPEIVPSGRRETILLVEDEEALRELARMILEHYKYRVFEAGSGPEALEVWEEHANEIDMLLTDMVMPGGMNGGDLAERIREKKPGIKVLYSSGYSPDGIDGCFELPKSSFFLAKPYHPQKLAQAVRECLDHEPESHGFEVRPTSAAV